MARGAINVKEIYWEIAKKALIGTELSRALSPYLLTLKVKTRHPVDDSRCCASTSRNPFEVRVKSFVPRPPNGIQPGVNNLDVNCPNVIDATRNSRRS